MRFIKSIVVLLFISISLVNCTKTNKSNLENATGEDGNWLLHGLNYSETRYSPLAQISAENIDQLGLDWSIDLGMKRGIEATPIVKDGMMYFTGPWSIVLL